MAQTVTKGRTVFYTFVNGRGDVVTRPAVVVEVQAARDAEGAPLVNLQVFTDGDGDGVRSDGRVVSVNDRAHNTLHVTGAFYGAAALPGTWAWPPRIG
jgi:hypothetical protein